MDTSIIYTLLAIWGTIMAFLILRKLIHWYWRINEHIDLLDEQNQMIADIMNHYKIKRT